MKLTEWVVDWLFKEFHAVVKFNDTTLLFTFILPSFLVEGEYVVI